MSTETIVIKIDMSIDKVESGVKEAAGDMYR